MQGIYNNIPETNCDHSVAAILLLLFVVIVSLVSVLNLLYFYINTFRSVCAVFKMAGFCSFIIIIIIIAIRLSLGGSSPYTSTDKTNKNKYT